MQLQHASAPSPRKPTPIGVSLRETWPSDHTLPTRGWGRGQGRVRGQRIAQLACLRLVTRFQNVDRRLALPASLTLALTLMRHAVQRVLFTLELPLVPDIGAAVSRHLRGPSHPDRSRQIIQSPTPRHGNNLPV